MVHLSAVYQSLELITGTPLPDYVGDCQQAAIGVSDIHTVKHIHPHADTQADRDRSSYLEKPLILTEISLGRPRSELSLYNTQHSPDCRV